MKLTGNRILDLQQTTDYRRIKSGKREMIVYQDGSRSDTNPDGPIWLASDLPLVECLKNKLAFYEAALNPAEERLKQILDDVRRYIQDHLKVYKNKSAAQYYLDKKAEIDPLREKVQKLRSKRDAVMTELDTELAKEGATRTDTIEDVRDRNMRQKAEAGGELVVSRDEVDAMLNDVNTMTADLFGEPEKEE